MTLYFQKRYDSFIIIINQPRLAHLAPLRADVLKILAQQVLLFCNFSLLCNKQVRVALSFVHTTFI